MAKLAKTTNMANRSYLYTTDNYTANDDEFTALGLSEYAHEISYLHQLMVAYDAKSIKSLIFDEDEETAVVAANIPYRESQRCLMPVLPIADQSRWLLRSSSCRSRSDSAASKTHWRPSFRPIL